MIYMAYKKNKMGLGDAAPLGREGGGLGNTFSPFMTTSDFFGENFNTCLAGGMY